LTSVPGFPGTLAPVSRSIVRFFGHARPGLPHADKE
jgi:hypothetical protein